jgi:rubrerythrin
VLKNHETMESTDIRRTEWKNMIKKEAKLQNEKHLCETITKSSKLEIMKKEIYEEKSYFTDMKMNDARVNFSLRSRMFNCKIIYLNNPVFKAEMWRCDSCQSSVDSQSHILYCPAYQQLSSDQDIMSYFKEVLAIRLKLNLDK